MTRDLQYAAAALIGVIAVARAVRLLTADTYPPVAWARRRYVTWVNVHGYGAWEDLATCPFCVAPYAAAVDLAWYLTGWWTPGWWVVNGWAALAYVAAMIVVRDTPPAED